jgi:hypothetical protein
VKRKITSALVYAVNAFALAIYIDSLYGAGPVTHGLWFINLAIVGMALLASAFILSLFTSGVGLVSAVAGELLSWPAIALAIFRIPWKSIISILPYANWLYLLIAIVALVVSSVYSVSQALLLCRGRDYIQRRNVGLRLVAALMYAAGVFVMEYWRGIYDWLFRLRYGS